MTDPIEIMARASFREAARTDRNGAPWFNGLEWDELPNLQPLFMDCARAALSALESAGYCVMKLEQLAPIRAEE